MTSGQHGPGVDLPCAGLDFEAQVWARRIAGASHSADHLTLSDAVKAVLT